MKQRFPRAPFFAFSMLAVAGWVIFIFATLSSEADRPGMRYARFGSLAGVLVFQALAVAVRGDVRSRGIFPWECSRDRKR